MRRQLRPVALCAVFALFVALAGCSSALQAIANAENDIPQAVTVIANTSTTLVQQGTMTPDEATKVATILSDVIAANMHAVAATKGIASLNTATKATISQIVNPIIQEIQSSVISGDVYNIKNVNAKLAITTAFTALAATLQIIQSKVQ